MWRPLLGAIGLAVVLAAPFLYYAATGFQSDSINSPALFDADSLNFLIPTHFIWIGGQWLFSISQHFRGNDAEAGSYLGIPTLVIVVWFAFGARRSAVARYLLVALAARRRPDARHGVRRQAARRVLAPLPGDREPPDLQQRPAGAVRGLRVPRSGGDRRALDGGQA